MDENIGCLVCICGLLIRMFAVSIVIGTGLDNEIQNATTIFCTNSTKTPVEYKACLEQDIIALLHYWRKQNMLDNFWNDGYKRPFVAIRGFVYNNNGEIIGEESDQEFRERISIKNALFLDNNYVID